MHNFVVKSYSVAALNWCN